MNQLKAFIGHSFITEDGQVVSAFLNFFNRIKELDIGFNWEHAESAEPKALAEKVLRITKDKNLFIGICTKKEYVIAPIKLMRSKLYRNTLLAKEPDLSWKTSDWIIQEIGLCIGRGMNIILLLEEGLRLPGGLQGDLEYIEFHRNSPEKSFTKVLEMIKALIAKPIRQTAPPESIPKAEQEVKPKQEEAINLLKPEKEWKKETFDRALFNAILKGDSVAEEEIFQVYLTSPEGKKEDGHIWKAHSEFIKILLGKGTLENLEKMAQEQADNSEIQIYLARALQKYEKFERAGEIFKRVAPKFSNEMQLSYLGDAAVAFSKAGFKEESRRIIDEMAGLTNMTKGGKIIIQGALKEIAEFEKDDEQWLGNTEALLDTFPDDLEMRFELAYNYSKVGRHDLALYHYTKIPIGQRSEATWNNIGVANSNLKLASKSIQAYRKSEEQGGTLAMSNIAYKFIGAGFLNEAEDICARAIKIENFDKTIGSTIARIKEVEGEEKEEQEKILKNTKVYREFYKDFGLACGKVSCSVDSSVWQGPKCQLNVEIREKTLTAEGSYEIAADNTLAFGLAGLMGSSPVLTSKVTKYRIRYEGTLIGLSAKCHKTEVEVDGGPKYIETFLGSLSKAKKCLMIISDRLNEIQVYEEDATESERFYVIRRSE